MGEGEGEEGVTNWRFWMRMKDSMANVVRGEGGRRRGASVAVALVPLIAGASKLKVEKCSGDSECLDQLSGWSVAELRGVGY